MAVRRRNIVLVGVYAALIAIALAIVDAEYDHGAAVAWAPALVGCALAGWGTGSWASVPLAFLPIVLGLAFGEASQYTGSDAPQVWWAGVVATPFCAAAIGLAVAARKFL